jgi:methylglutaconyl-CoA hydratase
VVQGRALAGGAGLVTACDLAIAGEGAQLGYPEIQRGFVPAMVMTLLRRAVGEKAALDLVLTGRVLSARDAQAVGLLTRVVPDGDLAREAGALLAALASASMSALALTKQLFYQLDGRSLEDGVALGARVNAAARQTPDFLAAIARFLER